MANNPNTRKRRVKARQARHAQAVSRYEQRRRRFQLWLVLGLAVLMILPLAAGIIFALLG
ncbi:MAG: hypothetical protein OXN44_04400 [Acidimicrobiaceae bacterium]|nr:hypothetical protein [Acidimicrobiaceae bacterium]MDE0606646.1 hypothetical protein [Acidimicrobiaceae bacterium]